MKKIILSALIFIACKTYSQDTITIQSSTAGTFELITTDDTIPDESEYTESEYTPTGGGSVINLTTESGNLRKSNTAVIDDNIKFSIYPNPGKGIYTVSVYNKTIHKIEITSIIGETIQLNQINDVYKTIIDISTLTKGIYFFKIICTDGSTKTEKVIFQ